MENVEIARLFNEVADILEIQGENQFRVRAYRTAARTIETLATPVESLLARNEDALLELPGFGRDLAGKVAHLIATGHLAVLDELVAKTPAGLVAIMHTSGLGPKRAKKIWDELGIQSLDELEEAARAGRLHRLHGIGKAIEQQVLSGIVEQRRRAGRFLLAEADQHARPLLAYLRKSRGIERAEVAGSYRRRKDTVGDIDILCAAGPDNDVAERFLAYPAIQKTLAHGTTRCAAILRSGLQVDVRIIPPHSYGAALHYFTGSKAHNIAVRLLGVRRKLKINEYGVFRGTRRIGGRTEEEVFGAVGLPWIPPELREDRGELDAARAGRLPRLVEVGDIRGDLHMHTIATDGHSTVAEMAAAAKERGYAYVAITDHTRALAMTGGMTRPGFLEQAEEIARAQAEVSGIRILRGAEVDILEDGSLDLDEQTLAELDIVVVAVHSRFRMDRATMTERICRALCHPRTTIFAHPSGRLLQEREPYAFDLDKVVEVAKAHNVLLEINSQPNRLDLDDAGIHAARRAGAKLVIDTDAHRTVELANIRYGVDQARRGWCEAKDIANTLPLAELLALIGRQDTSPVKATRPGRGKPAASVRR